MKIEWRPNMWLGMNYEAFATIDDRTESLLRAILFTEQFERLPVLKRAEDRDAKDKQRERKR